LWKRREAVRETRCVGETSRTLSTFGARYFADHLLRAILAAYGSTDVATARRPHREEGPACGIWTGDTLVGMLGSSEERYSAIGAPLISLRNSANLRFPEKQFLSIP
jgi:hypothetical protein